MNSFQGRQFEPIKTADFFFIGTGIDHFGRKAALAEFLINIVGPGISDIRAVFLEGHAKKEKIGPADIDLGLQKPGQDLAHHKLDMPLLMRRPAETTWE